MPRRPSTRTTTTHVEQPTHQPSAAPSTAPALPSELVVLRTNWKWAALSQFFFTFSQLMAMDDLSLNDIEEDLVQGNNIYLPRVMQRLLYTLSYDRKVTSNNWQTALRKQYYKRDPAANPIGPEPFPSASKLNTRTTSLVTPDPQSRAKTEDSELVDKVKNETPATSVPPEEIRSDAGQNEETLKSETPALQELAQEEESRDWLELSMLEKLDSMHLLMEWQFQNATRLRTLMKSDDDLANWRIEPIGYDAKRNAYWLVGADRLWIQREPPRPPRSSKSLKRKRPEPKTKTKKGKAVTTKRARIEPPRKRGKGKAKAKEPSPPVGRRGRAAKAQANMKLDAQARELAELNRQAAARDRSDSGLRTSSRRQAAPTPKSTPRGTRNSARLRGAQNDDEWQAVPEEWLNETANGSRNTRSKSAKKTGLESEGSSISDLTDLSEEESEEKPEDEGEEDDDDDDEADEEVADQEEDREDDEDEPPEPVVEQPEEQYQVPADFIEWETICVTLNEWEHIAERWQNATHYAEKALYKVLTTSIVPVITEELREIVRKKKVEEAVVHRKRSSRIAIKESVREEARQAIAKKVEEEEKMGRARRAEARQQKEEESRQRRENAREQRRKEREAQEAKEEGESAGIAVDVVGNGAAVQANGRYTSNGVASGSRTPAGEDWELDCEICLRRGINLDDGVPMMCCGSCSKWQHISCHDQADVRSGRPRRNWEQVEFICRNCAQTKRPSHYSSGHPPPAAGHDQYLALRAPGSTSNSYGNYNTPGYPVYNPYSQTSKSQNHGQMSDVRSNAAPSYAPPTKGISFTHYQPQQRGFSQTHSSYNAAPYVQPYGAPTTQYGQYTENGTNGYTYRSAPSARWSVTTPAQQAPGYAYPATERTSAGGRQYPDTQQWPTQKMTDAYSTGYHANS
ncbi:hypothetical protein IW261DRAFT_1477011 [Armillaria novae-zelandiae]|uniref:Zinc finger PHD-type domain-containing protein n=1 Tax=Armillaria novae-zelandiae TaxID=153914 RepID=A0AA39P9T9_9AGAR|nr:hypothetical protein IW261DRAFT_1477011 [Armillaria novae-zelandiae]